MYFSLSVFMARGKKRDLDMVWLFGGLAAVIALFMYALWRKELKDNHNLVQFIILIFLHPDVESVQRDNFFRLLKRLNAKDHVHLGAMVLLALSKHANDVAGGTTLLNSQSMWKARAGEPYRWNSGSGDEM
ncbi:MAG: hypothetical protein KGO02_20935 [Alphaproteobacteria bacterium]|nr:hypothetical protein [Alphaproteobacteria bacterium]